MSILSIQALTKRFGTFTAVDGIHLQVETGEIFGLLGPNGAGKSTLIKMLTTLIPPTSGEATVAGFDIQRQPMLVRRAIGYVPQSLSVDGTLTGYENLLIFSKLYDVPRRQQQERIDYALHFMGLEAAADQPVRTYSGGMIRRLEIAEAVLHKPQVLFLDEPTMGLDPVARRAVWELIKQLCRDIGMTVFLTTHFMEEADYLCQKVAIQYQGKVVAIGSPASLKTGIGSAATTLEEVFIHYTGDTLTTGANYRETSRNRRTAIRLG